MKVAKPGLVHDMTDADYHADPIEGGSLSSTFARLLTKHVPAKAIELHRDRKPTKAMNLGKAAHAHALGAGPELIVWQHDGRTRDGKAERAAYADQIGAEVVVAVTEAERDQITGMATALRANAHVAAVLNDADAEVSGFCQENGVWLRARYDLLDTSRPHDYKSCQDASRRGFQKAMANYGYHQQAEFYGRVLKALDHPAADTPMRFICQETEPPYLVQIHTPDEEALDIARELNDRAIRIYAESNATGTWAGYSELIAEPTCLPAYYWFDNADVLPNTLAEVELKLS